jgi:pyruvate/2-oxoglutarate dehydrogenase complex dihydrolipoamide acyltransferase (E2) component
MSPAIPLVLERDNVNDETVVLVRWFAGNGEKVEANVLIAEIETSKANVEVFSPQAGYLIWSFPEGADIPVSAPIGHISPVAPDAAEAAPQSATASGIASGIESGFATSPRANGVRLSAVVDPVRSPCASRMFLSFSTHRCRPGDRLLPPPRARRRRRSPSPTKKSLSRK